MFFGGGGSFRKKSTPNEDYREFVTMQDLRQLIVHLSAKALKTADEIEDLNTELAQAKAELCQVRSECGDQMEEICRLHSALQKQKDENPIYNDHHDYNDHDNNNSGGGSGDSNNNNNVKKETDYKYEYFETFNKLFTKFQNEVFANKELRQVIAELRSDIDKKNLEIKALKEQFNQA
jgi:chromosome segregation ATPase